MFMGIIMVYLNTEDHTKMYTPENKYEYDTILHLGSMSFIDHDNMKGATEYARRYLNKRYGSDPHIDLIPLYFQSYNTVTKSDALNLRIWAKTGRDYIYDHFDEIEDDVRRTIEIVKENVTRFCN